MTLYETPQMHIKHVFGNLHRDRGPILCFNEEHAFLEEEIERQHGIHMRPRQQIVITFAGSRYDVIYAERPEVCGYTIREHSNIARPLGLGPDGQRVTQLHFYRITGQRWQQLMPDQDVVIPQLHAAIA